MVFFLLVGRGYTTKAGMEASLEANTAYVNHKEFGLDPKVCFFARKGICVCTEKNVPNPGKLGRNASNDASSLCRSTLQQNMGWLVMLGYYCGRKNCRTKLSRLLSGL